PPISCTYAWTPPPACSAAPPFRSRSSRRTSATRQRRHSAARSRTATARHRLAGDETHGRNTHERPIEFGKLFERAAVGCQPDWDVILPSFSASTYQQPGGT